MLTTKLNLEFMSEVCAVWYGGANEKSDQNGIVIGVACPSAFKHRVSRESIHWDSYRDPRSFPRNAGDHDFTAKEERAFSHAQETE